MDTVIADQDGWRHLSRSSAQDEIEGEARLAGARRPADQDRALSHQNR
jgi:hypothetical protein